MTLKEIREYFGVERFREDKNKFLVFSNAPGSCSRMVYKYLCLITRIGEKFFVEGFEPTKEISVLKSQIDSYVSYLGYDSMYDNPHFIKGVREELMIHDYMDAIGFSTGYLDEGYTIKEKNVYGYKANNIRISFFGLKWTDHKLFNPLSSDEIPNEVTIYLSTGGYSWFTVKTTRDADEIKKGIDSLLKPLLVSESTILYSSADKLKNDTMEMDVVLKSLSGLDVTSKDYKAELKKKLLELADKIES